MAKHVYETMFLLDSNRYARDSHKVSAGLSEMIEKAGGEMLVSRLWNEQKLAYQINGHVKGTYWLAYYSIDSSALSPLNRACQLNENILRHMTLKVDPRLVEPLVAHAQGRHAAPPAGEAGAEASAEEEGPDASAEDAEAAAAGTDA